MTYGEPLNFLRTLSDSDLELTAQVLVGDQALVILRSNEDDRDDAPMLDTGDWSETAAGRG